MPLTTFYDTTCDTFNTYGDWWGSSAGLLSEFVKEFFCILTLDLRNLIGFCFHEIMFS
jgi:hypothetical protein